MARTDSTGKAFKGSQHQLQCYVNDHPDEFESALRSLMNDLSLHVEWRSPLARDSYSEYQDSEFLYKLDLSEYIGDLKAFWPRGGPVWDGLALAHGTKGSYRLLIEAKSHLPELRSHCAATPASLARIERALGETRIALKCNGSGDWHAPYYQYANRLAHLMWLRSRVPARLINVYFVDDSYQPTTHAQWIVGIGEMKSHLGLPASVLDAYDLFLPAKPY